MAEIKYIQPQKVKIGTSKKAQKVLSRQNISESTYLQNAIDKKRRNYLQASRKIASFNIKKDGNNLSESGQERDYLSQEIFKKSNIKSQFNEIYCQAPNQIRVAIFDSIQYYNGVDKIQVNKIFADDKKKKVVSIKISNIIEKSYVSLPILISEIVSVVSTVKKGLDSIFDLLSVIIISAINIYCLSVDELDNSFIPLFKAFMKFPSPYKGIDKNEFYNKVREFDNSLTDNTINEMLEILYTKNIILYNGNNIVLKEKIEIN